MSAAGLDGLARAGVTIAIPNWNHELLLPRAISSAFRALAQLREAGVPGEVLVIDEASRDGSPLLLRQLEALYYRDGLRVLSMADTASLAASRNLALVQARYRHIVFLDADNELIAENLPTFVRSLEATGAAMVYGNLLVRTPASRCGVNVISNESVQLKLFQFNYIDAFALIDRSQLIDLSGYQESYRALEDHEMWQHLAVNGRKIVFVPLAFGYYYVLPSSMATTALTGNTTSETTARSLRIYNQLQARAHLPLNSNMLRFHPELGYF